MTALQVDRRQNHLSGPDFEINKAHDRHSRLNKRTLLTVSVSRIVGKVLPVM